jgi:LCP family protein required for cell wall assembly
MPEDNSSTPKYKKGWVVLGVVGFLTVFLFSLFVIKFWPFINSFLNPPTGNISILVLGKGGVGHDAPDLTDTVIQVFLRGEHISLISLPRDIWVPEIRAKLNSAYYWGRQKNEGFRLVDESVGKITGQEVNYNLVLDFAIFKRIVDSIGGIEINVQNSFKDEKYPIAGKENDLCDGDKLFECRYETVVFEKGVQVMDGEKALKFVRSRNAEGDEGTDIAREKRQQLVIAAIQKKTSSSDVFLNPRKLKALWGSVVSSIETDIGKNVVGGIVRRVFDARKSVKTLILPEEFLIHPPVTPRYDNQYVFVVRTAGWEEVQKWITSSLQ